MWVTGVQTCALPIFSDTNIISCASRYQLDLCKKAVEENIIVYLGTGCGKTHIAVLLIYELGHLIRKPSRDVCIFLAPTVPLVRQVDFLVLLSFLIFWAPDYLSSLHGNFLISEYVYFAHNYYFG